MECSSEDNPMRESLKCYCGAMVKSQRYISSIMRRPGPFFLILASLVLLVTSNLTTINVSYSTDMISDSTDLSTSLEELFGKDNETQPLSDLLSGLSNESTPLTEGLDGLSNLSNQLTTSTQVIGNLTCNIPLNKTVPVNTPTGASLFGLQVSKRVDPKEIKLYGETGSNLTLPEKTVVTLSLTGSGETTETKLPVDVVFSIDASNSMKESDPSNLRLDAAKNFIGLLNSQSDRAGIVSWNQKVDFSEGLTSDFDLLKSRIDAVQPGSGTNLNIGLFSAIEMLDSSPSSGADTPSKAIVILTDGKGDYIKSGVPGSPSDQAKLKGYRIFSIGLNVEGNAQAEDDLKDIASSTGGQYYPAPTPENLQQVFDQIFQTVVSNTAPSNVKLVEATPSYILVDENSFSVPVSNISQEEDKTTIEWDNITSLVGNKDSKLDGNETFDVSYELSSSRTGRNLPVELNDTALVSFVDASGQQRSVGIPLGYLDVAPFESPIGQTQTLETASSPSTATQMWVNTDKDAYQYSDSSILFNGNVNNRIEGQDSIRVMICSDKGEVVDEGGLYEVNLDGSFLGSYGVPLPTELGALGSGPGVLDRYLYVEYGNDTAYSKFKQSARHIQVGANPESGITVKTDKTFYNSGEPVNVTGSIGKLMNFTDARLDVYTLLGDYVWTEQIPVEQDGSYSYSLEIPQMLPSYGPGTYVLEVTYDRKSAETKYQVR